MTGPVTSAAQSGDCTDASTDRPLLQVADLHVHLGRSHVLQGVGFDVRPGGVTALLGRNGVGKTTTVKAVLGLVDRRGRVLLEGRDVSTARTPSIVRSGVGYVPEDRESSPGSPWRRTCGSPSSLAACPTTTWCTSSSPSCASAAASAPGRCPAGSSRWWPWAGCCSGATGCCWSTSRRRAWRRGWWVRWPRRSLGWPSALPVLLVEQNLAVVRRLARDVVVLDGGRVVHTGPAADLLEDPALTTDLLGVGGRAVRRRRPGQDTTEGGPS